MMTNLKNFASAQRSTSTTDKIDKHSLEGSITNEMTPLVGVKRVLLALHVNKLLIGLLATAIFPGCNQPSENLQEKLFEATEVATIDHQEQQPESKQPIQLTRKPSINSIKIQTLVTPIEPDERMVYVTKTGTHYHSQYCRHLAKSSKAIPFSKAAKYKPCQHCNP